VSGGAALLDGEAVHLFLSLLLALQKVGTSMGIELALVAPPAHPLGLFAATWRTCFFEEEGSTKRDRVKAILIHSPR